MKIKNIFAVLITVSIVLFASISQAVTITPTGSGNWSSTVPDAPWPGGVLPGPSNAVEVLSGIVITVDTTNAICEALDSQIDGGNGTVTMAPGSTLTISGINPGVGSEYLGVLNATATNCTVIYQGNSFWAKRCDYYNLVFSGWGDFYNGIIPYDTAHAMNIFGDFIVNGTNVPSGQVGYTGCYIECGDDFTIYGDLVIGASNAWDCSVGKITVFGNTYCAGVLWDKDPTTGTNNFVGNLTILPSNMFLTNVQNTLVSEMGYTNTAHIGTPGYGVYGGSLYVLDVTQWAVGGNLTNNGIIGFGKNYGSISFDGTGVITGNPITIPTITVNGTSTIGTTLTLTTNTPTLNGTLVFDIASTNQIILQAGAGTPLYYSGNLDVINSGGQPASGASFTFFTCPNGFGGEFNSISYPSLPAGLSWINNLTTSGSIAITGTILGYPVITAQPTNQVIVPGGTTSFSMMAGGTTPLSYQWYFNNNLVNNATNSSLTISNAQQVNVGGYFAVVSDLSGSVTSSLASLSIVGIPDWINNGLVAYYPFNGNANDASGNGNDGTVTAATLTVDRFGNPNSAYAFDGVSSLITVPDSSSLRIPGDITVTCWVNFFQLNEPVRMRLVGKGGDSGRNYGLWADLPTSFWLFQQFPPEGDGGCQENTDSAAPAVQIGEWYQMVGVRSGSVSRIYLNGILLQERSPTCSATTYTGSEPLLIGAPGYSDPSQYLQLMDGSLDDIRIYDLALCSNQVAQLYAYESQSTNPPSITDQPQSLVVNAHDPASFSVTAFSTPPLGFQWSLNGTNILGATNSTLTISNVTQQTLGAYSVVVSNAFGLVTSSNAMLSMYPFLASPFTGVVTDWGKDATLSVAAWGTGPLSFQWFDNGVAILNATNQFLELSSIQFTNAGLYWVVVSSPLGSVTNTPEQVVVNPAGVSIGLYPGVTVSGVVGYTYIIQSTSNLSNTNSWVLAATLTLEQPIQLWVDINANTSLPGSAQKFYRVLPGQ